VAGTQSFWCSHGPGPGQTFCVPVQYPAEHVSSWVQAFPSSQLIGLLLHAVAASDALQIWQVLLGAVSPFR
jgi:hypothetical protein